MGNCDEETAVFLEEDWIRGLNDEIVRLPTEALEAILKTAAVLREDSEFRQRALDCHVKVFHASDHDSNKAAAFIKNTGAAMGEHADLFAAVMIVSGIPHALEFYSSKGIPAAILTDTFSDLKIWMNHHKQKTGAWGLGEIHWLLNHVGCKLFKIGRLQYIHKKWGQPFRVFRNRDHGEIITFADEGISFRPDGHIDSSHADSEEGKSWLSSYECTPETIQGHAIGPDGTAERKQTELQAKDWEPVLNQESTVLDVHIQEGEKLSPMACKDSLSEASEFYQTFFPEIEASAFTCTSWLLSPLFRELLPSGSNISQFGGLFRLIPVTPNDQQLFERVFGEKPADLTTAPRETQLQKTVLDYAFSGGYIGHGSGFILMNSPCSIAE